MALTEKELNILRSINNGKTQEAVETITRIYNELGISFDGKRVIDVGCRLAHKSGEMRKLGADVYGVDPFEDGIKWGSEEMGFIKPEQAFACFAQDLPEYLFATFDIATMFMYRVCPRGMVPGIDDPSFYCGFDVNDMQLQVTKALAKLIKPDGMVLIELINNLEDSYLFWPNSNCAPLMYQIKKVFAEAEYVETSNKHSIFIMARKPFDMEEIAKLNFADVCMPQGIEKFLTRAEELIQLGCYYTGSNSLFKFTVDRENKSLKYISNK